MLSNLWPVHPVMAFSEVRLSKAVSHGCNFLKMNKLSHVQSLLLSNSKTMALNKLVVKSSKNILNIFTCLFLNSFRLLKLFIKKTLFHVKINSVWFFYPSLGIHLYLFTCIACLCWTNSLPTGSEEISSWRINSCAEPLQACSMVSVPEATV